MSLFRWKCWVRFLWRALGHPPSLVGPLAGAFVDGHQYRVEVPDGVSADPVTGEFNAVVQILRCDDCGERDFAWR